MVDELTRIIWVLSHGGVNIQNYLDARMRHFNVRGKVSKSYEYPKEFVKLILKALIKQIKSSGNMHDGEICIDAEGPEVDWDNYWWENQNYMAKQNTKITYDGITGLMIPEHLVVEAKAEELGQINSIGVYEKVPIQMSWDRLGKAPIGVVWVVVNRGFRESRYQGTAMLPGFQEERSTTRRDFRTYTSIRSHQADA